MGDTYRPFSKMAERSTEGGKGGFGGDRGFGGGKGKGDGKGKGGKGKGGKGKSKGKGKGDAEEWIPCTKLGRLVKDGKIRNIDDIYYFSMPIKEYQIVDFFLPSLKDEVMKIMPVQKQTTAGQRTRFKAFVVVGDSDGHVGLGVTAAKEVGTGLVAGKIPKKVLGYAGIEDCFTSSRGATSTGGNFVKAVFACLKATYAYNSPDLWEQ